MDAQVPLRLSATTLARAFAERYEKTRVNSKNCRRLFVASSFMLSAVATNAFAADKPEDIATDFCKALAAQARCTKVFTMPRDTEAKLEKLAGSKLRGEGEPLHPVCNAGYSKFYSIEDSQGKDKACEIALLEFGPQGSKRQGLVVPRVAPDLKLPEAEVGQITTDLCYAMSVAKFCPGVSLTTGIESKLSSETGADLSKPGVGYFSSECGSGAFRAGLAKGKVALGEFCKSSIVDYGSKGTKRAGLLDGVLDSITSGAAKEAAPSGDAQGDKSHRIILTELPPLAEGQTPESQFGEIPATYTSAECQQLKASVQQAHELFSNAANLAGEVKAAIRLKAGALAAMALCPKSEASDFAITTASKVRDTGLEACHLVLDGVKEIDGLSKRFRSEKTMRGVLAVSEAKVWVLKEFAPTCSELTKRRLESSLKFAEQTFQRDQGNIACQIWNDAFRSTLKTAQDLQKEKNWDEAFATIDGKAAAAVHGMTATCSQANYADNAANRWVSSRKYLQQRALR